MNVIEIRNLNFSYNAEKIIENLNLSVPRGSFLGIAGPNGAGKSTILKLMHGQLKPETGKVFLDNKKISSYRSVKLARKIAMVRQEFIPPFGFSVYETVMMARTPFFNSLGFETKTDKEIIINALEQTEIRHLENRELSQLSGGERQRVFIARAIAQETPVLLLDEPTSYLDLKHQVGIFDLLKRMQLENDKTIITVTHDLNLAAQYCDKVLLVGFDRKYHLDSPEKLFIKRKISEIFSVNGISGEIDGRNFFLPSGKYSRNSK